MKIKILITAVLTMVMTNRINAQNKSNAPKVVVAYFSLCGTTSEIANQIKELTGAYIFDIATVKP